MRNVTNKNFPAASNMHYQNDSIIVVVVGMFPEVEIAPKHPHMWLTIAYHADYILKHFNDIVIHFV